MSKVGQILKTLSRVSISEVYISNKDREDGSLIEKLKELNKARIGKPSVNINGEEIPRSVTLSPTDFAIKGEDGSITIEYFNRLTNTSATVKIYKDEALILKKFI